MINILDVQDKLKNLSQQQLAQEMQNPSGAVPQYLVLSEISRRQAMQQSMQQQNAGKQTVAQELLNGAGIPAEGMSDMAQSMAPQSSIAQNTGIASLPQETPPPEQGGIAALAPQQPVGMFGGGPVIKMAGGSQGAVSSQRDLGPNSLYRLFGGISDFLSSNVNVDPQGNVSLSGPQNEPEVITVDPREANAMRATPTPITPPTENPFVGTQPNTPITDSGYGSKSKPVSGEKMSTYEHMLAGAMANADKRAKQDKWLALAQAGMALMSSAQPNLGAALGEAGTAGIAALQNARDNSEKTKLQLAQEQYNIEGRKAALARAAASAGSTKPRTASSVLKDISTIDDILSNMQQKDMMGEVLPPDKATAATMADLMTQRDELIRLYSQLQASGVDLSDSSQ